MLKFFLGVLTGLLIREIGDWLPLLGRYLIRRAARKLPEPSQTETREKWLAIATTLPGGGLTKVCWGIACNLLAANTNRITAARLVHFALFYVYVRIGLRSLFKLQFASLRDVIIRWQFLKMFGDQALAMASDDPNARQPLLELASKIKDERIKQTLLAVIEAMKQSTDATRGQGPIATTSPLTPLMDLPPASILSLAAESELAKPQSHKPPRSLIISSSINGIPGLLIGWVSGSWFEVLAASLGWGFVTWLLVTLIAGRGSHKPRFIVWWSIGFVPSLIVGTLTYILT